MTDSETTTKVLLRSKTKTGEIKLEVTIPQEHKLFREILDYAIEQAKPDPNQLPLFEGHKPAPPAKPAGDNGQKPPPPPPVIPCRSSGCTNGADDTGVCSEHRCKTAGCTGIATSSGYCRKCRRPSGRT